MLILCKMGGEFCSRARHDRVIRANWKLPRIPHNRCRPIIAALRAKARLANRAAQLLWS